MKISENVLMAFIASLPATIASLATLVNSLRNSKTLSANSSKIAEIHEKTNGMLEAANRAAHSAGMSQQRADDKADAEGKARAPIP
jgi:hypothetical protein